MELKTQFGLSKIKKLNKNQIIKAASQMWQKIRSWIFFVFLLISIIVGGFIWQKSLYGAEWSFEKKQEYINSQDKSILFKEDDFKKASADIQNRKERSEKSYEPIKDIFKPY